MLEFNVIQSSQSTRLLSELFETNAVLKLVYLYQISQCEYKRNGRVTADIGMSREKDLSAYIKYRLHNHCVSTDIDNEKEEDIIVNTRKISIKHSSNKTCSSSSIKIHWTENKILQKIFVKKYKFQCDILLVYVRFDAKNISHGQLEIVYISHDVLNTLKKKMKVNVFKTRNSNGRGIEFSSIFFQRLIKNCDYHLIVNFETEKYLILGPIERRLRILYTKWEKASVSTVIKSALLFCSWSVLVVKKCFAYLAFRFRYINAKIWKNF